MPKLRGLRSVCPLMGAVLGHDELNRCTSPIVRYFDKAAEGNVMTGAWGVALASHLCPNGVKMYGFTHNGTWHMGGAYPYYDEHGLNAADSLSSSALALSALAADRPDLVQLHTPASLSAPYPAVPCRVMEATI